MTHTYVVRRRSVFHFRIRIPTDLIAAVGRREVRMTLGEVAHKQAALKASQLVLHSQSFFTALRSSMKQLSPQQVAELVTTWRDRMKERDAEIRRRIEVGLHPRTLEGYADHCAANAGVFDDLLEQLTPTPAYRSSTPDQRKPASKPEEREAAYRTTADAMTVDDEAESDLVPIIDAVTLKSLDALSQRDLAKNYLMAAASIYAARDNASSSLTWSSQTTTPRQSDAPPPRPEAVPTVPPSLRLSQVWEAYCGECEQRSRGWKDGVPEKAALAHKDFIELIGDKPIRAITRADCTRFRDFQEKRPKGNVRQYRNMTAAQLEPMNVRKEDKQSSQNAEHKIAQLVTFFRWCANEHLIDKSPAENLKVAASDSEGVQPWSHDEMRTLLTPENLREHSGMQDGRSTLSYFPWLVVLGAYTGARIAEIVNVRIEDFRPKDEVSDGTVQVMIVDEYEGRTVKTEQAKRKIPLHPDLEKLGLWDYIAARRQRGETMLLDCPMKAGKRSKSATERFTKYTKRIGLHRHRVKVFHSFRHSFKTWLEGYIAKSDIDLIVGHSRKDAAGDAYTHAFDVPVHRHHEAIRQLKFDLDIGGLRRALAR